MSNRQARFTTETIDGVTVLTIHGEVDLANVDELKLGLEDGAETPSHGLVVDLTKATYFDSRTIALLAEFATSMRVHRQRMALVVSVDGFASRILQIAGLPSIIPSYPQVSEAVQSVKQPAGT